MTWIPDLEEGEPVTWIPDGDTVLPIEDWPPLIDETGPSSASLPSLIIEPPSPWPALAHAPALPLSPAPAFALAHAPAPAPSSSPPPAPSLPPLAPSDDPTPHPLARLFLLLVCFALGAAVVGLVGWASYVKSRSNRKEAANHQAPTAPIVVSPVPPPPLTAAPISPPPSPKPSRRSTTKAVTSSPRESTDPAPSSSPSPATESPPDIGSWL